MASCSVRRRGREGHSWSCRSKCASAAPPSHVHDMPRANPNYPSWLVGGQLPRLSQDDPAVLDYLRRGHPVVITGGCPLTRKIVSRWSFKYLADHFGECRDLSAHYAPRSITRFERFYGSGLGKGGVTGMSFHQFTKTLAMNAQNPDPQWRWYMQSPLVWGEGRGRNSRPGGVLNTPCGCFHHVTCSPMIAADLADIDWAWLKYACDQAKVEGLHSCTMWAGHGGGCTPMHFDALSNFFTQICGRKQVLVFPPAQSFNIYPFPCDHPMDSYAMADPEHPDLDRFPSFRRARGFETTLEPGDVLWLPSFYWHYVRQLDEGKDNLSLNCWVGAKADGSTILGGRQHAFEKRVTELQSAQPLTVEALSACTKGSLSTGYATGARRGSTRRDSARAASARASSQQDADETMIADDGTNGLRCLLMARWLETEAPPRLSARDPKRIESADPKRIERAKAKLGPFLNAMAAGADDVEELMRRGAKLNDEPIGAVGSETHTVATKLRLDVMAQLGGPLTCAILRGLTRDGRLHPGLAPRIEGNVVNSEKGHVTPAEEVRKVFDDIRSGAREADQVNIDES